MLCHTGSLAYRRSGKQGKQGGRWALIEGRETTRAEDGGAGVRITRHTTVCQNLMFDKQANDISKTSKYQKNSFAF